MELPPLAVGGGVPGVIARLPSTNDNPLGHDIEDESHEGQSHKDRDEGEDRVAEESEGLLEAR